MNEKIGTTCAVIVTFNRKKLLLECLKALLNQAYSLNAILIGVVEPIWVEIAYTWTYPDFRWKERAIEFLKQNDIYQIGRYGLWEFQGIAKSIKNGLGVKYGR